MKTADFDYYLPPELIAQHPAQRRDESRLLVLRKAGGIAHSHFYQLPQYLKPGDLLVLNDTKVRPARLFGEREDTGSSVEVVFCTRLLETGGKLLSSLVKKQNQARSFPFGGGLLKGKSFPLLKAAAGQSSFTTTALGRKLLGKARRGAPASLHPREAGRSRALPDSICQRRGLCCSAHSWTPLYAGAIGEAPAAGSRAYIPHSACGLGNLQASAH